MDTNTEHTMHTALPIILAAARIIGDTDPWQDYATDDDRLDAAAALIRAGWAPSAAATVLGLRCAGEHVHVGHAWASDDYHGTDEAIPAGVRDLQAWADEHAQECAEIAVGSAGDDPHGRRITWRMSVEIAAVDADGDRVTVEGRGEAIEDPPAAKACTAADRGAHEWCSPHSVVGGIAENPGVRGHGGGVVVEEICRHCGMHRTTDTWATDRTTGRPTEQVTYRAAGERSLAWLAEQRGA